MNDEHVVRMIEREAGAPDSVGALMIERWFDTRPNPRKSKSAGYPIFEEVPWIRIIVPGEKNNSVPERPSTDQDNKRFPRSYETLMTLAKNSAAPIDGMPIEHWPRATRSMAMTLKAVNIPTVEALAAVQDSHIDRIGPNGRQLRSEAQAFLAVSKDSAAAQRIQAESDAKDATMADMQRQIRELAAKLEKQHEQPIGWKGQEDEPARRGPGRPRKEEAVV